MGAKILGGLEGTGIDIGGFADVGTSLVVVVDVRICRGRSQGRECGPVILLFVARGPCSLLLRSIPRLLFVFHTKSCT
jgi:hypothetical protein